LDYFKQIRTTVDGRPVSLSITDNAEQARKLRALGEPVAIYLHEGSRNQDWSDFLYAVEDPEALEPEYVEKVCRRLLGLPWNILETPRLLVRETVPDDVDPFCEIYNHPDITKYTDGLYPDREQERKYIQEYIEKVYTFYEFGVWTVVERESRAVVGRAGFSYRAGFKEPELGFIIGAPWQRRGYAWEVCRAILQYGGETLGFKAVQALVEPGNEASVKLCKRLGFCDDNVIKYNGNKYIRFLKKLS